MTEDIEYDVGFKKPPIETQFKKGQSGNPKGRPKNSKNLRTSLEIELQSKITVTENGKATQISKVEALAKTMVNKALQGNLPAMLALLKFDQSEIEIPEKSQEFSQTDKELIESYFRRKIDHADRI